MSTEADLAALRREVNDSITATDEFASELLHQVAALEEIVAARWPRSVLVRARLRRGLRASVRHIDGDDFTSKRVNSLASGWMSRRVTGPD